MQRMHNELPSAVFPLSTRNVSFPGVMFIRGGLILPESYSLRAADMWCYTTQTSINPIPRVPPRKPRALLSRGPGCKACYRQNSENKSQKHISDLGIYTGAAPHCLILFNRGSKKFISNGNGFFIFSAIWFQHPNAQNCKMTSPAGMVRGLLNLRSFIINLTVCVGAFAKSEASFMC